MVLSTAIWSAVCLVTFELARRTGSYDYRAFTRQLLQRWWFLFEICYLVMMLLGLAVIAAASGSIVEAVFSLPYYVGVIGIMACVGFLVFKGTAVIEKSFAVWSFVLYAIYLVFLVWSLSQFFGRQSLALAGDQAGMGPVRRQVCRVQHGHHSGPSVLHPSHGETSGGLRGRHPGGAHRHDPGLFLFSGHGHPVSSRGGSDRSRQFSPGGPGIDPRSRFVFQVVLLGTLIESGTGMIHAFNERVAGVLAERRAVMPAYLRPAVALLLLVAAASLAPLGLKNLVAEGYGSATWGVILCYVLPVLTIGLWKIWRRDGG